MVMSIYSVSNEPFSHNMVLYLFFYMPIYLPFCNENQYSCTCIYTLLHYKVHVNGPCFIFFLDNLNEWIYPWLSLWRYNIRIMVFNATFNNIMVKETGVPGKNTDLLQVTDKLYHLQIFHMYFIWCNRVIISSFHFNKIGTWWYRV
jgi:hypothetical protein